MGINTALLLNHNEHLIVDQKKRKFTRIFFDRLVDLNFFGDLFKHCQIKDLSLTGMFILHPIEQNIGEYCLVRLTQTSRYSGLSLHALAKVVRKNKQGIAIEFVSMSFDSYIFLQLSLLCEAEETLTVGLELPDNCPFEIVEKLPISSP